MENPVHSLKMHACEAETIKIKSKQHANKQMDSRLQMGKKMQISMFAAGESWKSDDDRAYSKTKNELETENK